MSRIKYVETNVPKNTKLRVHYLQQGKVPGLPKQIKRVTVAQLFDKRTGSKVSEATSFCHENDNDNKKIGRAIAVGRALKGYYTQQVA